MLNQYYARKQFMLAPAFRDEEERKAAIAKVEYTHQAVAALEAFLSTPCEGEAEIPVDVAVDEEF